MIWSEPFGAFLTRELTHSGIDILSIRDRRGLVSLGNFGFEGSLGYRVIVTVSANAGFFGCDE